MASPKTITARYQDMADALRRRMTAADRPTTPRDRTLRGKARIRARKNANRQENA